MNDNMIDFILENKIERWKIFQVLFIDGENNKNFEDLKIT